MLSNIYHTLITEPLYNGLILLMDIIPWADAGVAIIIFTFIVKFILFPLSKKAVTTQMEMKKIEPELAKLREQFPDKQVQAKKTLELYRSHNINPFSGILLLLIQLPIIFGLYKIFLSSGLPEKNIQLLYSFVNFPANVNMEFLNFINISEKSLLLALIAGITTFIQIRFSIPPIKKDETKKERTFKDDLARSMNFQMRYFLPIVAFFVSWTISGAIALYWITSNIFTIGQEMVIRRRFKKT